MLLGREADPSLRYTSMLLGREADPSLRYTSMLLGREADPSLRYTSMLLGREADPSLRYTSRLLGREAANTQQQLTTTPAASTVSPGQVTSLARYNDGDWHTVTWRRLHTFLLLSFDDATLYLRASLNPYDPRFNLTLHLYLGARPFRPGRLGMTRCVTVVSTSAFLACHQC